jgi:hypothetical protein
MQQKAKYPKRPMRAALLAFVILPAFVGAFIPFDAGIRDDWPLAFGYCALLAIGSIGLARLAGGVGRYMPLPVLADVGTGVAVCLLPVAVPLFFRWRHGARPVTGVEA